MNDKVTRRKNGDVEWKRVGDLVPTAHAIIADIEVGLRHDGPGRLQSWQNQIQAMKLAELKRVVKAREGLTPEIAPEYFDGQRKTDAKPGDKDEWIVPPFRDAKGNVRFLTTEGLDGVIEYAEHTIADVAVGIRGGSDIDGETDGKKIAAELRRFGLVEIFSKAAMEMQALTRAEQFPAADSGDVG